MGINVVGGNFFYSSKPYGVINGIDFGCVGCPVPPLSHPFLSCPLFQPTNLLASRPQKCIVPPRPPPHSSPPHPFLAVQLHGGGAEDRDGKHREAPGAGRRGAPLHARLLGLGAGESRSFLCVCLSLCVCVRVDRGRRRGRRRRRKGAAALCSHHITSTTHITSHHVTSNKQTFNVVSEHLATEAAAALQANKLIFITEGQTLVDTRTGHVIQNIRLKDAKALLEYHRVVLYPRDVTEGCMVAGRPVLTEARPSDSDYQAAILRFTRYSVQALNKGVRRSHLVSPGNGRLLQASPRVCVWKRRDGQDRQGRRILTTLTNPPSSPLPSLSPFIHHRRSSPATARGRSSPAICTTGSAPPPWRTCRASSTSSSP